MGPVTKVRRPGEGEGQSSVAIPSSEWAELSISLSHSGGGTLE